LPTEAQWEYAARSGGKDEIYSGGNDVDAVAWYWNNSGKTTHVVGTKSPNGLGIFDMSGNVWEWCEDVYDRNAYSRHSKNNPLITTDSSGRATTDRTERVFRGGNWGSFPAVVRCTKRLRDYPGVMYRGLGFRLVRKKQKNNE
jgi:formylglycine-generating enzyme required for sulfatase activity